MFHLFLCYQLRGFSKQQKLHFFFSSWLDKPLQTSNLLHEAQVTWLLDRTECRISSLIPSNADNPEFPILRSQLLEAAWCEVHRGYYVDMRPVPGSTWICFAGVAWKAVLSLFQTELIPVWVGLQQIAETMPALPWHSWASAHGRGALHTFGSDFYRAATAQCAPWKTAEHTAELIRLALPFPSLPIPHWIYPGSKPAPEKPRQN